MLPPLFTTPSDPLPLDDVDAWVLPRVIGRMVGAGRARDAVRERALRPADLDEAELGEVESVWLPVWRVQGSVDSFGVGLVQTHRSVRTGRDVGVLGGGGRTPPRSPRGRRTQRSVMPSGSFRHHDGVVSVTARRGFFLDPGPALKLPASDLVPRAGASGDAQVDEARLILPNLRRADAERVAELHLERRGQPHGNTLLSKTTVQLHDARLCLYPLYVQRYHYAGEAVDGAGTFFAAVSGTTGKVIASRHPSAWSSVGSRLRAFFSTR